MSNPFVDLKSLQMEKYQKTFKQQYEDYRRQLEIKDLLRQAEEARKKLAETPEKEAEEDGTDADQKQKEWEKLFAKFSAWMESGEQLTRRIKEIRDRLKQCDLSEAERKILREDLEHLAKLLSGIFDQRAPLLHEDRVTCITGRAT